MLSWAEGKSRATRLGRGNAGESRRNLGSGGNGCACPQQLRPPLSGSSLWSVVALEAVGDRQLAGLGPPPLRRRHENHGR